jgi:hypothetical protein
MLSTAISGNKGVIVRMYNKTTKFIRNGQQFKKSKHGECAKCHTSCYGIVAGVLGKVYSNLISSVWLPTVLDDNFDLAIYVPGPAKRMDSISLGRTKTGRPSASLRSSEFI